MGTRRYCPRCKEHQTATKEISLWTLPEVLVVHLKRFATGRHGMGRFSHLLRGKLNTPVRFPLRCASAVEGVGGSRRGTRLTQPCHRRGLVYFQGPRPDRVPARQQRAGHLRPVCRVGTAASLLVADTGA